VLYLIWKSDKPKVANGIGQFTLIGLAVGVVSFLCPRRLLVARLLFELALVAFVVYYVCIVELTKNFADSAIKSTIYRSN